MTHADGDGTRRIEFRCGGIPDAVRFRIFTERLAPAECRCEGGSLRVDYSFPAASTAEIWRALVECGIEAQLASSDRLRCRLRAALEQNERTHLRRPAGLRRHADRVGLLLAPPPLPRAGSRRLWRKHERRR